MGDGTYQCFSEKHRKGFHPPLPPLSFRNDKAVVVSERAIELEVHVVRLIGQHSILHQVELYNVLGCFICNGQPLK